MPRADHDPAQAEAVMQPLQEEARRLGDAVDEAKELVEDLEREIDVSESATEVQELQDRHYQAERALEDVEQEYNSVMDQVGEATRFWYLDDDDDEND